MCVIYLKLNCYIDENDKPPDLQYKGSCGNLVLVIPLYFFTCSENSTNLNGYIDTCFAIIDFDKTL